MTSKQASITLIENHMPSSGIGNYKGVMLCNRPFAGTAATFNKTDSTDRNTFSCGKVNEPLGIGQSQIPVTLNLTGKTTNRKKKISVVTKHKKWLAELQKTKEEMEEREEEERKEKETTTAKFMENEAKLRQRKRESKIASNNGDDENDDDDDVDSYDYIMRSSVAADKIFGTSKMNKTQAGNKSNNQYDDDNNIAASSSSSSPSKINSNNNKYSSDAKSSSSSSSTITTTNDKSPLKKDHHSNHNNNNNNSNTKISKPKWAMSENDAKEMSESKDYEDEEDLLSFVDKLDFKRYVKDIEVQSMMEKLKLRISELETDIEKDMKREKERKAEYAKMKVLRKAMIASASASASSTARPEIDEGDGDEEDDNNNDDDDDAYESSLYGTDNTNENDQDRHLMEDAKRILRNSKYNHNHDDEDERNRDEELYDLESIHSKRSMAAVLKSLQNNKDKDGNHDKSKTAVILNEPVIVLHDPSEGTRRTQKFDIAKLPYMHRNPAI